MVSRESKTSWKGRNNKGADPSDETRPSTRKQGKKSRPLDATLLRDLALSYVARFSTTGAKLEQYLARKIRERGVAEDADGRVVDLDVKGLAAQFVELGYIDDDAYARSKSRDLTARGYGARRVEQALWAAGVDEEVREGATPGDGESRRAAVLLAKKRRFGPFDRDFGTDQADDGGEDRLAANKKREKQVAAMLRAGHSYEHVRFILDAINEDAIEEWLSEAEDDDQDPRKGGGLW